MNRWWLECYDFKNLAPSIETCSFLLVLLEAHIFLYKHILELKVKTKRSHGCFKKKFIMWLNWFLTHWLVLVNIHTSTFHTQAVTIVGCDLTQWGLNKMADIFADGTFNGIFLKAICYDLIQISLKFVPKDPIDHKSSLVQVMAWCRTGNKPLHEPMMTLFIGDYIHHQTSMSQTKHFPYRICIIFNFTHRLLFLNLNQCRPS